uniref:Uncharacterized protein n=1 Tax=Romanomermis culicivorax TaxID=13658 RepID=A0A915IC19_ROMCU
MQIELNLIQDKLVVPHLSHWDDSIEVIIYFSKALLLILWESVREYQNTKIYSDAKLWHKLTLFKSEGPASDETTTLQYTTKSPLILLNPYKDPSSPLSLPKRPGAKSNVP